MTFYWVPLNYFSQTVPESATILRKFSPRAPTKYMIQGSQRNMKLEATSMKDSTAVLNQIKLINIEILIVQ